MFGKLKTRLKLGKLLHTLLEGCEELERHPQGNAKNAFDEMISYGDIALPMLEEYNLYLLNEHQRYCEKLKSGSSENQYNNYSRKSEYQKQYRYVIEFRQARIVDVIEAIRERDRVAIT